MRFLELTVTSRIGHILADSYMASCGFGICIKRMHELQGSSSIP